MPQKPSRFKHRIPSTGKVHQPMGIGYRLSGGRWTKLRNLYLREHPLCSRCGSVGQEVHHIVPRLVRPDLAYTWDNLMTLCKACHLHIHQKSVEK